MAYARIGYAYAVTWGLADKAKPYLEKAFRLADRLTEKDRLYITGWYQIANLDYAGAISSFQEIRTKYPLEIEAYVTLAHLLQGEERLEEAAEVARQALLIDAGAKKLYNELGGLYLMVGRHDEAIAMFRHYVELAPKEPNAHDSLGLGYQWTGHYAEAIQEYERALALNPKFEVAVIHLGNVYFQQGRYRESIAQYNRYVQAAASDMERARGYHSIALVQLKKGDLDEAEAMAKKAFGYDKLWIGVSIDIALERGDVARAQRLLEQTSQWPYTERGARPNMRGMIYLRGRLKLKSGHAAEAVEDFKEALGQRPLIWDIDSLEDCLANAYLELGRFEEAVSEYERILRLNPNYPLAHYHLAQAYERTGNVDRARDEYSRFLQIWETADTDLQEVLTARAKLNL
ncbi:MAG: tetratricopeptide repeat protein [Acidobacteriota bacterium]|nr:tetratricopeptide repeat protein [Acidobacteriota bacterium]